MSLGLARVVAVKLKGESLQTMASTLLRGLHELFLRFARSLIIKTAGGSGGDRSNLIGLNRDIWGIHHPPSEDSKCPQDTSAVLFVYPSPPKVCIFLQSSAKYPLIEGGTTSAEMKDFADCGNFAVATRTVVDDFIEMKIYLACLASLNLHF
jgi:hypothetical protein